jgi:hypothetical protein
MEIHPMSNRDHNYNDPDLRPIEFLFEVMHDPSVPMEQRIAAADWLMWHTDPRFNSNFCAPTCTIQVPTFVPEP